MPRAMTEPRFDRTALEPAPSATPITPAMSVTPAPLAAASTPATPAKPTAPESPAPARIERSQWERVELAPDVELHIRRPSSRATAKRVDRLISIARDLFREDPS